MAVHAVKGSSGFSLKFFDGLGCIQTGNRFQGGEIAPEFFLLLQNGREDRGEVKQHGYLFLFDERHRFPGIELAHIDVQGSCMKTVGDHEEAADMKQGQKIQMDIFRCHSETVVPVHIGAQHIAVAEQCTPGSSRYRRCMNNDEPIIGCDIHRHKTIRFAL